MKTSKHKPKLRLKQDAPAPAYQAQINVRSSIAASRENAYAIVRRLAE